MEHYKSFRSGTIQLNASYWEGLLGCTIKCFVWGIYRNQGRLMLRDLWERMCERKFASKFALTQPRCCYMTTSFERLLEISTICLANLYKHSQVYHVASVMVVGVIMQEILEIHCDTEKGRGSCCSKEVLTETKSDGEIEGDLGLFHF